MINNTKGFFNTLVETWKLFLNSALKQYKSKTKRSLQHCTYHIQCLLLLKSSCKQYKPKKNTVCNNVEYTFIATTELIIQLLENSGYNIL